MHSERLASESQLRFSLHASFPQQAGRKLQKSICFAVFIARSSGVQQEYASFSLPDLTGATHMVFRAA
ncbi:MAG: hypothetical protein A2V21_306700 [Deltaproteobacteria bacterium GWC2_55_46]|nr:MAG: hypothetical protein A2V21_306700 [Deltaproteobacteria bacterium GWC2_55_46]